MYQTYATARHWYIGIFDRLSCPPAKTASTLISLGSRFAVAKLGLGTSSSVLQACKTRLRCSIPDANKAVCSLREDKITSFFWSSRQESNLDQ